MGFRGLLSAKFKLKLSSIWYPLKTAFLFYFEVFDQPFLHRFGLLVAYAKL